MAAFHPLRTLERRDATIMAAKRSLGMDEKMQKPRRSETPAEREQRFVREAQLKRTQMAANEADIDRMIRRNIAEYGP